MSRRGFLLTSAVTLGCGRRRGTAFPGYAFVANAEGRSLAIVDLTTFSVARRIPLDASPAAVIAHPDHAVIYALTPANGTVVEVDGATLAIRRKLRLGASAVGMRLAPDALSLWVLMAEPRQLVRVPLDRFITTIVGANESGKSHLLSAIAKVINGEGISDSTPDRYEIKDICRYCGFGGLDEGVWPEIGIEIPIAELYEQVDFADIDIGG